MADYKNLNKFIQDEKLDLWDIITYDLNEHFEKLTADGSKTKREEFRDILYKHSDKIDFLEDYVKKEISMYTDDEKKIIPDCAAIELALSFQQGIWKNKDSFDKIEKLRKEVIDNEKIYENALPASILWKPNSLDSDYADKLINATFDNYYQRLKDAQAAGKITEEELFDFYNDFLDILDDWKVKGRDRYFSQFKIGNDIFNKEIADLICSEELNWETLINYVSTKSAEKRIIKDLAEKCKIDETDYLNRLEGRADTILGITEEIKAKDGKERIKYKGYREISHQLYDKIKLDLDVEGIGYTLLESKKNLINYSLPKESLALGNHKAKIEDLRKEICNSYLAWLDNLFLEYEKLREQGITTGISKNDELEKLGTIYGLQYQDDIEQALLYTEDQFAAKQIEKEDLEAVNGLIRLAKIRDDDAKIRYQRAREKSKDGLRRIDRDTINNILKKHGF